MKENKFVIIIMLTISLALTGVIGFTLFYDGEDVETVSFEEMISGAFIKEVIYGGGEAQVFFFLSGDTRKVRENFDTFIVEYNENNQQTFEPNQENEYFLSFPLSETEQLLTLERIIFIYNGQDYSFRLEDSINISPLSEESKTDNGEEENGDDPNGDNGEEENGDDPNGDNGDNGEEENGDDPNGDNGEEENGDDPNGDNGEESLIESYEELFSELNHKIFTQYSKNHFYYVVEKEGETPEGIEENQKTKVLVLDDGQSFFIETLTLFDGIEFNQEINSFQNDLHEKTTIYNRDHINFINSEYDIGLSENDIETMFADTYFSEERDYTETINEEGYEYELRLFENYISINPVFLFASAFEEFLFFLDQNGDDDIDSYFILDFSENERFLLENLTNEKRIEVLFDEDGNITEINSSYILLDIEDQVVETVEIVFVFDFEVPDKLVKFESASQE